MLVGFCFSFYVCVCVLCSLVDLRVRLFASLDQARPRPGAEKKIRVCVYLCFVARWHAHVHDTFFVSIGARGGRHMLRMLYAPPAVLSSILLTAAAAG